MATHISHQTVRLTRGKHSSPAEGACVMELASMLAGEPFTDRPRSVCPVIASYLRALNDLLDDRHRQLLYPYAAAAVGTAGDDAIRRMRLERCGSALEVAAGRSMLQRLIARTATSSALTTTLALEHFTLTLVRALRRAGGPGWHGVALALAGELTSLPAAECDGPEAPSTPEVALRRVSAGGCGGSLHTRARRSQTVPGRRQVPKPHQDLTQHP
jgi:hypothetical protein